MAAIPMTSTRKWVISCGAALMALVLLFPPWQQTRNGVPLSYNDDLGRHALWNRPAATGETYVYPSLLPTPEGKISEEKITVNIPASECRVSLNAGVLWRQCGIILAITAILFFGLRSLTFRKAAILSLLVALCLPAPTPDLSIPIAVMLGMSPWLLYQGEFGSVAVPFFAAFYLAIYFAVLFFLIGGAVWLDRRYSPAQDQARA
jgi:hypothetical protein